ncbi:acetyl-CoA synthetase-like protein [Aspergillus campestris IBT 28561]|uniref:Acetyl-CoA synthetase-like protein n=1 Tax=Aspergillus campestris (strain IBT 28561) TaxID=1392248 RepID=A0A2I1CY43_ASPC2|nr:acetyl-CoA synthetase-like protein [Aspergillus campestris IBT 28561]PKY02547.1 acetyl-CoA synthetase-like protein [Aspergillus campestris IBT 28561]
MGSTTLIENKVACAPFDIVHQQPGAEYFKILVQAAWAVLVGSHTGCTAIRYSIREYREETAAKFQLQLLEDQAPNMEVEVDFDGKAQNLFNNLRCQNALASDETGHKAESPDNPLEVPGIAGKKPSILILQPEGDGSAFGNDQTWESQSIITDLRAIAFASSCNQHGHQIQLLYNSSKNRDQETRTVARQMGQLVNLFLEEQAGSKSLGQFLRAPEDEVVEAWWKNRDLPESHERCVHDIWDIAQYEMGAPAIHAWDGRLSYGNLIEMSTALAEWLVAFGLQKGAIVPLCIQKSRWMPVAVLAVAKAGGVCIAIDVNHPEQWLQLILQQVNPSLMLCTEATRKFTSQLAGDIPFHVVDNVLNDLGQPAEKHTSSTLLPPVDPHEPVYISYTSGSTGMPKGAVISHSNVCSAVTHLGPRLGFSNQSRVFDLAPYCFDVAWTNLFHALCSGGCLCVPAPQDIKNDLTSAIERFNANIINITPSALQFISPKIRGLEAVLLSGEPANAALIELWAPRVNLFNTYGAAECPSKTAVTHISKEFRGKLALGDGIANNLWVVNPHTGQHLAPTGTIGELWIEGPTVGQGYLRDIKSSTTAYVKNPPWLLSGSGQHDGRPGQLYRTGDLVRYDLEGRLIYMGRKGQMAKIRGQRVEFGTIEHHILKHLGAETIAAVEIIHPHGDELQSVLTAFLVVGNGAVLGDIAIHDLDQHMDRSLPTYMKPSVWVVKSELPRTPTGKIDRRRLQKEGNEMSLEQLIMLDPRFSQDGEVPNTAAEGQLQSLWASVLGVKSKHIGRHADFFRLGGDSISAIKLVAAARNKGLALSVEDVFRHSQLYAQAASIADPGTRAQSSRGPSPPFSLLPTHHGRQESILQHAASVCSIPTNSIMDIFPCTPIQESLLASSAQWTVHHVDEPVCWSSANSLEEYFMRNKDDSCDLEQVARAYHGETPEHLPSLQALVQHLQNTDEAGTRSFWKAQLGNSGAVAFPSLPAPNYEAQPDRVITRRCPNIQWKADNRVTPSNCLRAAWAFLTARYTGSSEVLFGATVSGRKSSVTGIETMAGPVIATVPLRVTVDDTISLEEFLHTIQQQEIDMIPFEHTGLRKIRSISPDIAVACDFNSLFVVQPASNSGDTNAGQIFRLRDTAYDHKQVASKYQYHTSPLLVECLLESHGVTMHFVYDEGVIDTKQVNYLAGQLEHVLRQMQTMPSDPEVKLSQVTTASQQDLHDISSWNAVVPEPVDLSVGDLISRTIQEVPPEAPAVCAWDGSLSYELLNLHHLQLAGMLVNRGLLPGDNVAICLEKSMWLPVTLLAVAKAGLTSVSVDVCQPQARLKTIFEQVRPRMVLASKMNRGLAERLIEDPAQVIIVSDCVDQTSKIPLLPAVLPSYRLCIIFTSGSTGTPKGTILTHRNFSSAIKHHCAYLGFNRSTRTFDFASHAFDASWFNSLHTLYAGGCICIPSEDDRRNNLADAIQSLGANFSFLPPGLAKFIDPSSVPSLTDVYFGGERVPDDLVQRWCERGAKVGIGYGPTECTVFSTLESQPQRLGNSIGRGVGLVPWVVHPVHHNLVGIGQLGELWLEGPLVSEGYLELPQKTATVFVTDPPWLTDAADPAKGRHATLYRTGDLVRYNPDGRLTYMRRADDQVKIRGQRVELTEVEYHVRQAIDRVGASSDVGVVAEVVTLAGKTNPMLLAILAPESQATSLLCESEFSLQEILMEQLPSFMVPSAYAPIAEFPLTVTGKIDRRCLRQVFAKRSVADIQITNGGGKEPDQRRSPASDTEEALQRALSDTLNIPIADVPMDVSFVRLGGDSISAMQVVSACRIHGVVVTVIQILRYQTIERIAAELQQSKNSISNGQPLSLQDEENDLSVPWDLSPIQKMFFKLVHNSLHHFNQAFLFRLKYRVPADSIFTATQRLVDRHPLLRARYQRREDGQWQQYCVPSRLSLRKNLDEHGNADTFGWATHVVSTQEELYADAQCRQEELNIERGPVFRIDIYEIRDGPRDRQAILFTAHHLVVDFVSWRIIWLDLQRLLTGSFMSKEPPTSFRSWCQLQRKHCEMLREEDVLPFKVQPPLLDYWGLVPGENTHAGCASEQREIDRKSTALIVEKNSLIPLVELVDIIIGVLLHSFHQSYPDRAVPAVYVEGHGRESPDDLHPVDLSETVGWFTTICPVQIAEASLKSLGTVIQSVRDVRRKTPGKGRPYFALRWEGTGRKNPSNADNEGMELMFNFAGAYQQLERSENLFERDGGLHVENQVPGVAQRFGMLEVSAGIQNDHLTIRLEQHKRIKHKALLPKWADLIVRQLRAIGPTLDELLPGNTEKLYDSRNLNSIQNLLSQNGIDSASVVCALPCTAIQKHMLMAQRNSGEGIYNVRLSFQVPASNNADAIGRLAQSWKNTVKRYEILRTVFVGDYQVVLKHVDSVIFPGEIPPDSAALPSGPAHAISFTGSPIGVTVTMEISHALTDKLAMDHILQDWSAIYHGDSLPHASLDYAAAVERILDKERSSKSLNFWEEHLALTGLSGSFPVNSLVPMSMDNARRTERRFQSMSALRKTCQENNITTSNFLCVSWGLTLAHKMQQNQIVFGMVTSGDSTFPNMGDIKPPVGPRLNIVPCVLHNALSKDARTHMQDMYHFIYEALEHEGAGLTAAQSGAHTLSGFSTVVNYRKFGPTSNGQGKENGVLSFSPTSIRDLWGFDIFVGVEESDGCLDFSLQWYNGRCEDNVAEGLLDDMLGTMTKLEGGYDATLSQANISGYIAGDNDTLRDGGILEKCVYWGNLQYSVKA